MPDYDEKAVHKETIEYYRLTLAAHKKDPHAVETAGADDVGGAVENSPANYDGDEFKVSYTAN